MGPAGPVTPLWAPVVPQSSWVDGASRGTFTFGLIQLQPRTAQGITPLSALKCSVVNAS